MPPKSESAPRRRPRRETTPGPSNAEIMERLNFIANVLGVLILHVHEKMPPDLMFSIVERCGIHVEFFTGEEAVH